MDSSPSSLCDLTAVDQAALLRSRQVSARELLAAHVERIEAVDGALNAIVTRTFDRARARAQELDDAAARGQFAGPLHGLVIAHKDLSDTAGVRTTYGSPVFADHVPDVDHPIVTRLTAAGVVCVGKTNTPEFGAGSNTFNPVFGATRNPWNPALTPGGSSGGAAAAVATGMLSLADGSDVGGSLRNPPAFCGVVGLRPSVGRVPNTGPGHQHHRMPTHGPIGRCVDDVALGLAAMAGPDAAGLLSLPEPGSTFLPPLDPDERALRVAFSPDVEGLPVDPVVRDGLRAAADRLAAAGWQLEEVSLPLDGVDACFAALRAFMYACDLGRMLSAEQLARVKATVQLEVRDGLAISTSDVADAIATETVLAQRIGELFTHYDLILAPTVQVQPFPVETEWVTQVDGVQLGRYTDWMRSATRFSVLGVPAISVPSGLSTAGLPLAVQLIAARGQDLALLRAAKQAEQVLGRLPHPPLPLLGTVSRSPL